MKSSELAPLLFTVYLAAASGRSPALPCFAAFLALVRFSGLFAFTQLFFQTLVSSALALQKDYNEKVSSYLLQCIVRHGLITRNDTRENTDRLESKFFPKAKKPLLIERAKDKYSKK